MESYSLHAVTSMMYSLDSLKLNDVFIRVFQLVAFCCPIISPFFSVLQKYDHQMEGSGD